MLPDENDKLKIIRSDTANESAQFFKINGWMPSAPGDLQGFNYLSNCATSLVVQCRKLRLSSAMTCANVGIFSVFSRVKTDAKNLFIHSEISLSSVNVFPLSHLITVKSLEPPRFELT